MDKRSIIFILCVSAAFFLANLYFTQQQQEQEKQWRDYQALKQERILKEKLSDIEKRTKSLEQLPLVEIYSDSAASGVLASGVLVKGAILTMGWDTQPEKLIYARPYKTTEPLVPYQLNLDEKSSVIHSFKDQPIVYSQDGKQTIEAADIPLFGAFDVQLVTLLQKNGENDVDVGLGEITDGKFESFRPEEDMTTPPAIALFEKDEKFYPVGIVKGIKERLVPLEEFESLRGSIFKEANEKEARPSALAQKEKFYVLENGYQQLVFSNIGGSLVEINLPFQQENSGVSVVKPIEVDRDMIKIDPKNALFPLEPYYKASDPKTEQSSLKEGGYYPLIRRNFIEPGTLKEIKVDPQFYALNLVSEYPELSKLVYEVKEYTPEKIVFEAKQKQRKITKTFRLDKTEEAAPYIFDVDIKVEGDSRGLWLTTGVLEVEWITGAPAPALMYRSIRKGQGSVETIELPADASITTSITPNWICNSNGFFGLILDPLSDSSPGWRTQKVPGATVVSRLVALEREHPEWTPQDLPGYMMMLPLPLKGTNSFRIFAGPFSSSILKKVDAIFTDPTTKEGPDYLSCQTFHGWFAFISEPFAKFLFWIMEFFYSITGSWAFSIVLVTLVLRILLYPLNAWSTKSMLAMQKITPKMQALQEKYKNDKPKLQAEMVELYKREKVNPFSGCLPLLIQMPFLIGMFDLLKSTFALRGASFIPGWIDDLAAPDVLFSWNYHIPFLGSEFHLLPILLGLVMFFQSRMGVKVDPSKMTDQQRQQKASGTIMALLFTVLFYRFPSGLNIYWLSSMLLGMLQQWLTAKKMNLESV